MVHVIPFQNNLKFSVLCFIICKYAEPKGHDTRPPDKHMKALYLVLDRDRCIGFAYLVLDPDCGMHCVSIFNFCPGKLYLLLSDLRQGKDGPR